MAHVVVVGAGLGGLRTVEFLRAEGFPGRISLVGDEPHEPYDRPPLSKQILAGQWPEERAALHCGELADLDVSLRLGTAAVGVDSGGVELDDGTRLRYDALVVATGVRPRRLPGQPDHPELHVLRRLEDCRALRDSISRARSLLVVGAGFIGAEVAATARTAGLEVTMLEALSAPFARVLGERMGRLCARLQTDNGVAVRCGTRIDSFLDGNGGIAARLADGSIVRADCGVVGVGTVLDVGWLARLGVPTEGGLLCDVTGLVEGTGNVYAVGDIAAWRHPTVGDRPRIEHWTSATEQAAVVAQRITGKQITRQADVVPYFWSDQYGLTLQLAGRCDLATSVEVLHDPGVIKGTVAGYFADGALVAVLAFHAPRLLNRYRKLVAAGAGEHEVRSTAAELASQ
ncbi:MAG: FAD-dependent oxidoreductase [Pseudonocardiales bacterium]|nr:FAD-dependent oxidoreductase [Pseudonocardiales bacterium]MBV9032103.1 FAD-dependent oxidoreductase [Pseudonocardiales bacterium]MBW0010306.1 FAD-dependent oxidoreductase [Pseudonocardiales bacterium]